MRNETLRVSDFMSLRRVDAVTLTASGGTPSHGRRVLLRKLCALPRVLSCLQLGWPNGINLQLVPSTGSDCLSHGPRAVSVHVAYTVRGTSSAASGRDSGAHIGDARLRSETASSTSRTCADSNPRADRAIKIKNRQSGT